MIKQFRCFLVFAWSLCQTVYFCLGPSKMSAKNNASEKALRDIIISRMLQSPKSQALKAAGEIVQQSGTGSYHMHPLFITSIFYLNF